MKKLLIALFSLCLIFTVSNVNACETCGCKGNAETVKKECSSSKADANSGATKCCKTKCSKSKSKCCKSKKACSGAKGKYSSGSTSGFNFSSSNSTVENKKCGSDLEAEATDEPTEENEEGDEEDSDE